MRFWILFVLMTLTFSFSSAFSRQVSSNTSKKAKTEAKNDDTRGLVSDITIIGSNNIDFVLSNSKGQKLGFNPFTNSNFKEIKLSAYFREFPHGGDTSNEDTKFSTIHIQGEKDVYRLEVYGRRKGEFQLTVSSSTDLSVSRFAISETIEKNQTLYYSFKRDKKGVVELVSSESK